MASTEGAVAVMGAGAWGTALAKVLADAGGEVTLWARRSNIAQQINTTRYNPAYLPGTLLPPSIRATSDAEEALRGVTTVLLGVPAQMMRANLENWKGLFSQDATLVSLAKGIELGTLMRMSQVIVSVTGADPSRVAVISGPNLASEIAECQPAATVVACSDSGRAVAVQRMLNSGYFRPYTNSDVVGTEVGGACKNVIALACGMAAGVGLGENTAAAIITRGLAEIMRLGIALGAKGATLAGLAGVGDLVATCTSPRSRNRSFGERLGRGATMESALGGPPNGGDGHVVEGVTSCESVLALASSYDVEMPLTDAVHRVCHKGLSVDEAMALLLGRRTKPE
jgi:glycerol-3-phosphate dehydrogenase (NAD(P)+)